MLVLTIPNVDDGRSYHPSPSTTIVITVLNALIDNGRLKSGRVVLPCYSSPWSFLVVWAAHESRATLIEPSTSHRPPSATSARASLLLLTQPSGLESCSHYPVILLCKRDKPRPLSRRPRLRASTQRHLEDLPQGSAVRNEGSPPHPLLSISPAVDLALRSLNMAEMPTSKVLAATHYLHPTSRLPSQLSFKVKALSRCSKATTAMVWARTTKGKSSMPCFHQPVDPATCIDLGTAVNIGPTTGLRQDLQGNELACERDANIIVVWPAPS